MKPKPTAVMETVAAGQQYRLAFYEPQSSSPKPTAIREMPEGERPVQRLTWYGPGALSLAELLTVSPGSATWRPPSACWPTPRVWPGWPRSQSPT